MEAEIAFNANSQIFIQCQKEIVLEDFKINPNVLLENIVNTQINSLPIDKLTITQMSGNFNEQEENKFNEELKDLKQELKEIKEDQNLAFEINNLLQKEDPFDIADKMTKKLIKYNKIIQFIFSDKFFLKKC